MFSVGKVLKVIKLLVCSAEFTAYATVPYARLDRSLE